MSSDEDAADLVASFKKGSMIAAEPKSSPGPRKQQSTFSVGDFVSEDSSEDDRPKRSPPRTTIRRAVAVRPSPIRNPDEYVYYEPKVTVESIVREYELRDELWYEVKLVGGVTTQLSFDQLLNHDQGPEVFQDFRHHDDGTSESESAPRTEMRLRGRPPKTKHSDFVSVEGLDLSSEDELAAHKPRQKRLESLNKRGGKCRSSARTTRSSTINISSDDSDDTGTRRRRKPKVLQEPTRRSERSRVSTQRYESEESEDDESDSDDMDILRSDVTSSRKRRRPRGRKHVEKIPRVGTRQSDRPTRAMNNMQEADINDIYRSDSDEPKHVGPKIINVKETFITLSRNDPFRARHAGGCEVCYNDSSLAPLIYCQGCSLAYHKNCLGNRSSREHLVTKVGEGNYVLQCRRCINVYRKKDAAAPDLSMCQDCRQPGLGCQPFRHRKTTAQEQKDRDENNGLDPVVYVPPKLINNHLNVLFRCTKCSRAYHYHHLPPLSPYAMDVLREEEELADERFAEYSKRWMCKDCDEMANRKVSGLIAWRPSDVESYRPGTPCDRICEDDKQYLIKWEGESYFRAAWFSGAWTWGVTAAAMRKAFFKREDGPKMRTEDAIPEEFLRIDIVLDVKYTSFVDVRSEEILKARIKEVDKALIKYKGLGYEDAVWEKVPTADDGDRWLDFVTAYNDWVAGRYIRYPKQGPLKARLEKVRLTDFSKLEKSKQPESLVGGELMKYQIEGLNWLYYQWYCQKNGILADEMGLGKTIQVIAFMATLIEHNCFPFLVVVPNSTCANWRREIKQWVPSLRVVTFFGSSAARDMAYKYEMFPEGTKELRAHIVVTSYEAATDDSCARIFRGINWAGLIVDEGQRLKNDKSQLYGALNAVKAPFRLLLTGTPLQNNARELFNLLQFLDENINAAELEEKYTEMTSENVKELHDQIRPFILRRTKAQVLTFLPALGQIILPISMSVLQKNLYKSILKRNPELLKALFTSSKSLKQQERANLSNILMQLRKCLCHPFVYSREIEERTDIQAVSHRNLVEASAKLQLLELLLPKLQERGHRVLIFSQFLDMLSIVEDFMDGMQMAYQRLDGTMGSLEKQKRIDQFNAPDSPLFAFLLSTRAGGVGINLATADTVIILDPDFNPHQDIQAISRAHRIGQKKKVLCFQLMTRASVEEKIVQMGRKKMALDHVVVQELDTEDIEEKDVESILKFGAAELFNDDNADQDIRYDDASIEKLLDRSQLENTKTGGDDSVESQFSFARVWANQTGALEDNLGTTEEEVAPDPGVWDKILKERQAAAAAEALARANALGRGKRARMNVDYATEEREVTTADGLESALNSPVPDKAPEQVGKRRKRKKPASDNDTDFHIEESEDDQSGTQAQAEAQAEAGDLAHVDIRRGSTNTIISKSLYSQNPSGSSTISSAPTSKPRFPGITLGAPGKSAPKAYGHSVASKPQPKHSPAHRSADPADQNVVDLTTEEPANAPTVAPFERAQLPIRSPLEPTMGQHSNHTCAACHRQHPRGACELKAAGVEHCGLCGLAHFGHGRTCPHIRSETQVREMLLALQSSPEKKELVDLAVKYLRGVKGHLVQQKKKEKEKALALAGGYPPPGPAPYRSPYPSTHPGQPMPVRNGAPSQPVDVGSEVRVGYGVPPQGYGVTLVQVDVPPVYHGHTMPAPGSVGSHLMAQGQGQPQGQPQGPVQGHGHGQRNSGAPSGAPPGAGLQDYDVENALRGFLGR